jgi:hypothetical protein
VSVRPCSVNPLKGIGGNEEYFDFKGFINPPQSLSTPLEYPPN